MLAQNFNAIQNAAGLPLLHYYGTPGKIITTLLPYIFSIAGLGFLVFFVVAGIQMMTSRGDPKAMQAAQAKITTAAIGFLIVFMSYALVRLIGLLFGLTIFGTTFPG